MSDDFFELNGRIILKRWPRIWPILALQNVESLNVDLIQGLGSTLSVNGLQLTSRHDREKEAVLQASSLPDKSIIHIYGVGLGDLPRILLSRGNLKVLKVRIMNCALFALVLRLLDQSDWLIDDRVELMIAAEEAEISLPFFALPSELMLIENDAARIRDRLIREISLPIINRRFDSENPDNIFRLESNLTILKSDADVRSLFDSAFGATCLIIAPGPTLKKHLPYLGTIKNNSNRPLLICLDTAYKTLQQINILPDFVVTIDDNITQERLPADSSDQVKLIYFPIVPSETLLSWRGARYAAYSNSPLYNNLKTTCLKGELHSGGSVIIPAVDLAVKMGATNIIFLGADFSFPYSQTHTGWEDGSIGPSIESAQHWIQDGRGKRVPTNPNFAIYLCELERYIKKHIWIKFWNTSYDGANILGCSYHPDFIK